MRLRDGRLAGLSIIKTMSAAHVDHETLKEVRAMATELRERRAQDDSKFSGDAVAILPNDGKPQRVYLSGADVEVLKWTANEFRWEVEHAEVGGYHRKCKAALEVLERLTKGSE
jgi:hypothetical protein